MFALIFINGDKQAMLRFHRPASSVSLFQPIAEIIFKSPVLVDNFDATELNQAKRLKFQGTSWKFELCGTDKNQPILPNQIISIIGRKGNTLLIHAHKALKTSNKKSICGNE